SSSFRRPFLRTGQVAISRRPDRKYCVPGVHIERSSFDGAKVRRFRCGLRIFSHFFSIFFFAGQTMSWGGHDGHGQNGQNRKWKERKVFYNI
ncbi:MAG: hypothetical protein IIZ93_14280, partial [Acidaminococcaceae bacterium]|nr:hypothetical protein [Acidaminococcaceae bacterium]